MRKTQKIGLRGERVAERHLRKQGMTVLARNWRGGGGEIDLALLDGKTLIFVEVKARSRQRIDPRMPVTMAQRRRTAAAAGAFRRRFGVTDLAVRFDLIEVDALSEAICWEKNYYRHYDRDNSRSMEDR